MNLRTIARFLVACALLSAGGRGLTAQTDYGEHKGTDALSIGLSYSGGGSILLDPATNYKVAVIYGDRIGLDASYPLNPTISTTLGFALDNRGGKYYWYLDKTVWEIRKAQYFSINPGIRISALYLGFNLGFPLSGVKRWQNGPDAKVNSYDLDPATDKLNTMVGLQLGAVIPLVNEKFGWLGLTIIGDYNFSDFSDKTTLFPGEDPAKPVSSQSAVLRLGLTGQYAIPGTYR